MPRAERPLDLDGSALTEFAAGLRKLRQAAGGLPYRELAKRAHFSSTTLSDAAGGRRLPSLTVALAYVAACDGDRDEWERRWHAVAAELDDGAAEQDDTPTANAPYVGLAPYGPSDADRFFGRERLVGDLLGRLRRQRLLAIFGPSGSGKSSILRAGLVPELVSMADAGPVVLFTPGPHPLKELALRLAPLLGTTASVVEAEISADPRAVSSLCDQVLLDRPHPAEVVIVVDQLEEIFTLCADRNELAAFLALLLGATSAGTRCRVVLGVRADFYAHCAQHEALVAALQDAQITVGPMTADELRRVITRPATSAGCAVEADLLSVLVAHTHGQAGVLPLLSHALLETWRRRKGNTLTLAGFQAAGGLDGALVRTAETIFGGLTTQQQHLAERLFKRLVVSGENTEDTRRRLARDEIEDNPDTNTVIGVLGGARLVTLDRDTVEITHEALIGAWPRLQRWLNADREGHRIHRELSDSVTAWEIHHRDPALLLRGNRLAVIADWAARSHELTSREHDFLEICTSARDRRESASRRRIQRQNVLIVLLTVVALLASAALTFAVDAERRATEERNAALALRAATAAMDLIPRDPKLAAQLALAAHRLRPSQETREALVSAEAMAQGSKLPQGRVTISSGARTLALLDETLRATTIYAIDGRGHPEKKYTIRSAGVVKDERFSPDGGFLAVAVPGGSLEIWDLGNESGEPKKSATLPSASVVGDWSPDGRYMITGFFPESPTGETALKDHPPVIWDLAVPANPVRVRVLEGVAGLGVKFAGDGRTIANNPASVPDVSDQSVDLMTLDHGQPRVISSLRGNHNWSFTDLGFPLGGRRAVLTQTTGVGKFAYSVWDLSKKENPAALGRFVLPDGFVPALGIVTDLNPDQVVTTDGSFTSVWNIGEIASPKLIARFRTGGAKSSDFRLTAARDGLLGVVFRHGNELTLVRWQFDPADSIAQLCAGGDELPAEVRAHYFPGVSYSSPC